jgi:hypothetical protein
MKKVMWEEDAAVVATPLFQEFQEGEEEERSTVKLKRKRTRSCDDDEDNDVEDLRFSNPEEEEAVPAWMRYAPRRKLSNSSPSLSASSNEDDRFLFCGSKHSSNPFSPTFHKNVIERKQRQPLRQATKSTQKKKIKYLSNNVNEASELLSYFTLSKT